MQPDLTVEIVGAHRTHDDLYHAALDHANAQADSVTTRPITLRLTIGGEVSTHRDHQGVAGFGEVWVEDSGPGSFARWALTQHKCQQGTEGTLAVFASQFHASLEATSAWAAGFAAVLCEAGIRASIHIGVD